MERNIELTGGGRGEGRSKPGPKPKHASKRAYPRGYSLRGFHMYVLERMVEEDGLDSESEAVQRCIERMADSRGITRDDYLSHATFHEEIGNVHSQARVASDASSKSTKEVSS
jgi:hypothetical protein